MLKKTQTSKHEKATSLYILPFVFSFVQMSQDSTGYELTFMKEL